MYPIKLLRWDAETNSKFIHQYQRHECLWDPKNPFYKHRQTRNKAYQSLAEYMGMGLTPRDVITKIRVLRNTYNTELLKTRRSEYSGSGGEVYCSKIPWLHSFDFLKDVGCYTKKATHYEMERREKPEMKEEYIATSEPSLECVSCSSDEDSVCTREPVQSTTQTSDDDSKLYSTQRTAQKRQSHQTDGSSSKKSVAEENEFEILGRNIAVQLATLPIDMALETQEMLLAVLRKQRMRAMKKS